MEKETKEIKRNWSNLSKEEKLRIIKLANSLFVPPNFVKDMYENNAINIDID